MGCLKLERLEKSYTPMEVIHGGAKKLFLECGNYYPFGMEMSGNWQDNNANDYDYLYNGKEIQRELGLGYYDYGARYYDPSVSLFLGVDPLAGESPAWNPYRNAFNNPLVFIDPNGLHEWRINSETGETEKIGDKGGDKEQYIYWNEDKAYSDIIKGSEIYVGPVAKDWYSDEIQYAVHTTDLWSDVPEERLGEYTKFDLADRYNAMLKGDPNNILEQEQFLDLHRRDMIWDLQDYGRYLDNKYGRRDGYIMAMDNDLINTLLGYGRGPALQRVHKALTRLTKKKKPYDKDIISKKFYKKTPNRPGGGNSSQRRKWRRQQEREGNYIYKRVIKP